MLKSEGSTDILQPIGQILLSVEVNAVGPMICLFIASVLIAQTTVYSVVTMVSNE